MKPTLTDLAEASGVSTATVDRVLNDRPGASARTRKRVTDAARAIGYLPGAETAIEHVHLVALLPQGTNEFMEDLRAHLIIEAAAIPGVSLEMAEIAGLDASAMAEALSKVGDVDGVAVVALNHPRVHDALLRLSARAIPVVTLVSDLPDSLRHAYIGIDNLRAGRLAGEITTRFLGPNPTGEVALFASSLTYRGHQERDVGLRQYIEEEAPNLTLLELRESGEERARAHAQALELLDAHPAICAIYNAGGGTAGIAQALKDRGRENDVIFVAHEATDTNKALLLDGTLDAIIDQNARREAQEALSTLFAIAQGQLRPITKPRLHLILKENIPSDVAPRPATQGASTDANRS